MTIGTGIALVSAGAAFAVLGLGVIRRLPVASKLRDNRDVSGLYVGIIAAIYGVVLGFMVLAVWTRFDQAEAHTEEEAATVGTVARLAHALPSGKGDAVISACRVYADKVQSDEWKAMMQGQESVATHRAVDGLWEEVLRLQTTSPQESLLISEATHQMSELSRLRRLRLLACRSSFPTLLWAVLIAGAVLTVGASLLLWTESFALHALQVCSLCFVIGLVLLATAELSTPFNGDVHIDPDMFTQAIAP